MSASAGTRRPGRLLLRILAAFGLSLAAPLAAQQLEIRRVEAVPAEVPTLQLELAVSLGEHATAALEAGLVLSFDVEWRLDDGRRLHQSLSLRHSPLLRSYQLAMGAQPPRPYAVRDALLAAMENARLRWTGEPACPQACGGEVRVRLDPAALPAPLRLPALFDGEWDFDSGWKPLAGPPA